MLLLSTFLKICLILKINAQAMEKEHQEIVTNLERGHKESISKLRNQNQELVTRMKGEKEESAKTIRLLEERLTNKVPLFQSRPFLNLSLIVFFFNSRSHSSRSFISPLKPKTGQDAGTGQKFGPG